MKYYIDPHNAIFAYAADGSQNELINDNLKAISEKEALAIAQPKQSKAQLIADAEYQKQALLNEATTAIAPLQDAVDLGIAIDEEREQLIKWKEYRVLLSRIDISTAPDIDWPKSEVYPNK